MNAQDHGFYLLLAYGVSAVLLLAELLSLWLRCRRARDVGEHRE
jgi:heme exporter protein CcmD